MAALALVHCPRLSIARSHLVCARSQYIEENVHLLEAAHERMCLGRLHESLQYQVQLQQNLIYLATYADEDPNLRRLIFRGNAPESMNVDEGIERDAVAHAGTSMQASAVAAESLPDAGDDALGLVAEPPSAADERDEDGPDDETIRAAGYGLRGRLSRPAEDASVDEEKRRLAKKESAQARVSKVRQRQANFDDCGMCTPCLDKAKFGGPNRLRKACAAPIPKAPKSSEQTVADVTSNCDGSAGDARAEEDA